MLMSGAKRFSATLSTIGGWNRCESVRQRTALGWKSNSHWKGYKATLVATWKWNMNVIPIYKGTIFATLLNGEGNWNYSVPVNTNIVKKTQMKTQYQIVRSVFVNLVSTWNASVIILSRDVLGKIEFIRRLKGHFSKKPELVIQANAHTWLPVPQMEDRE